MFYPDHYNGAFAACPDPVDFRAYTLINLYSDKNAFYIEGRAQAGRAAGHARLPRPHARTMQDANAYELALGTHGRSGEQWDIWQAVYDRSARTAIRSRSSTRRPARSTTVSPSTGASIMI